MPLTLQVEPDELGMLRVVVGDKDTRGHGSHSGAGNPAAQELCETYEDPDPDSAVRRVRPPAVTSPR
ncbi:hypothetical protein Acy02nite_04160 [Actinoplanes cyaneus]|uniref:Uncharacterized protein n=1 Tax=Actinoplanes cyaneus TaxID=52696 RepID=A0A919IAK3_9ACTN|nr:hypothetical protein Acy02nite_04160 [Actinoplanes cyaneus]